MTTQQPQRPASKAMHPNRSDYPPAAPVICPSGPLLCANIETSPERAGHCYRRNSDHIWVCINCKEPRP